MAQKKRNHYIPVFMLKHWLASHGSSQALHYYEIAKKQKATCGKNNGFKFAARNDLYVPKIGGARDVKMEEWFGRCESALASLVRHAATGGTEFSVSREDASYLQKAIHGLRLRSRHDLEMIREAVAKEQVPRELISASPERDIDRLVLENMRNTIDEQSLAHNPLSMQFLRSKTGSFILSDRPWIEDPRIGNYIILTNRVALRYEKSGRGQLEYSYHDAPDDIRQDLNKLVALQARDWLVADNAPELDQHIDIVCSPEWEAHREQDHITGIVPTHLRGGADFEGPQPD